MGTIEFQPAENLPSPIDLISTPSPPKVNKEAEVKPPPQQQEEFEPVEKEVAVGEIERLNKIMEGLGNRLEFGLYDGTDEFFVQIVDRRRNEVVKMLPPEHLLSFRAKIQEAVGLILDERK